MKALVPYSSPWFSWMRQTASSTPLQQPQHRGNFILSPSEPSYTFLPDSSQHCDSILVKVDAAAINPIDYKVPPFLLRRRIVGIDFCGTIQQVGKNIQHLHVGDTVYGAATTGSLAEFAITESNQVAKTLPGTTQKNRKEGSDDKEASTPMSSWKAIDYAALPVAYQSALQSLRRGGIVPPIFHPSETREGTTTASYDGLFSSPYNTNQNKSLLVIGASGGCGLAGLQLAKAMMVPRRVAICSEKNSDFVKKHGGATEVIDYSNKELLQHFFDRNVGQFDCVYDAASYSGANEDYWTSAMPLLKPDGVGKFVALNGPPLQWMKELFGLSSQRRGILLCKTNTEDLSLIVKLLDSIHARPVITTVPFTDDGVKEAFDMLQSRRTKGKIVFDLSIQQGADLN